jgi:hypothetical protein
MAVSVRVGLGHGLQLVTFGRAGQHHRTVPDRDVRSSVTHDMTNWIYRLPVTAAIWLGSPTLARAAAAVPGPSESESGPERRPAASDR